MARSIRSFSVTQDHLALDDILRLSELGLMGRVQANSKVFYVNPSASASNARGFPYEAPVNTIAKALALCTSGQGDFVLIQPTPGTNITEYDVSVAKGSVTIASLADPTAGMCVIKPTTDPTTSVMALTAAADNVMLKNLILYGSGDGGNDKLCLNVIGGANNVTIDNCYFIYGSAGITTSNVASCQSWVIKNCRFIDMSTHGVQGYFKWGIIKDNLLQNTDNSAWSAGGILVLDNTTTADSDGCMIVDNTIMAGVTAVMATGISVAANCLGVGIVNNMLGGLATKPVQVADGIATEGGNSIIHNFSNDVGADASTGEYEAVEDKVIGET
uniref:Pectate lyase n=1 Tax=viral metagenome TaxID=1070528 RepID=A0A6M3JVA4_9ZZZZ